MNKLPVIFSALMHMYLVKCKSRPAMYPFSVWYRTTKILFAFYFLHLWFDPVLCHESHYCIYKVPNCHENQQTPTHNHLLQRSSLQQIKQDLLHEKFVVYEHAKSIFFILLPATQQSHQQKPSLVEQIRCKLGKPKRKQVKTKIIWNSLPDEDQLFYVLSKTLLKKILLQLKSNFKKL